MLKLKKIQPESYEDFPVGKKYFPSLHFDNKEVSEIKNWEVGKIYQILLEIKQNSKSESKDGVVDASFDITAYKVMDDMEDMSDDDMEKMQAKGMSS